MKILQAGMAKSGNFWLYKIIQGILSHGGLENKSFIQNHPIHELAQTWDLSYKEQADIDVLDIDPHKCFYRISSVFRMPIEDIDDYIQQCNHVWTHSHFCQRSVTVLPKFDKIVYIIRDPRDRAISAAKFRFTPYMQKYYPHGDPDPDASLAHSLTGNVRSWVQHGGGYLRCRDELQIHFVFYERLLHAFGEEVADLLEYLDIELSEEAIAAIKRDVEFNTMKRENPHHVRKGRSGRWREVLTDAQKQRAARIAGPMLEILNYPVYESQTDQSLPCLPTQLDSSQIEKAIAHANRRTFREKVRRVYKFITS